MTQLRQRGDTKHETGASGSVVGIVRSLPTALPFSIQDVHVALSATKRGSSQWHVQGV